MPKFRPLPPIASAPISRITPDSGEEPLRRAHEVEASTSGASACRRRARSGCEIRRRAAHRAEDRLGRSTAVNSETSVPMPSMNAKPLTPAVARTNRMNAIMNVTTFASMIAVRPLLVARGDARGHRSAAADLLLDAFEDDDVRVGRDADRQDQARDARQRQRDRDQLDQREEVERVDAQRADRDHAEDAVEDEQEQRDDREADDAGDQALVQRLLAERRRDLRRGDQLQLDRQRAGLQQVREVLGRLDREAARDLRAVARVDAVRVLLEVDVRDRDQLVVEHDREVLEGGLRVVARDERLAAALGDRARGLLPHACGPCP